ncbi:MAG: Hsp33 family molecular chaperone HslO [Bdellovibrionales bacterium]|nr:Hsp33 family molecular chaperone HslO [Bdellovibrionales bacterium]
MLKLPRNPSDRWVKCLSSHGNIRGVAIQARSLVRAMAELHEIRGTPAVCLGEAVIGALLVASNAKGTERVNLNIKAAGPVRQALVDAYPDGRVRGYVISSELASLAKHGTWGEGLLSVLRTKTERSHQPYIGTVPLLTGQLAKDLTFYWSQSEQIPSAVGLSVTIDDDGKISGAGGFLVQALPEATPEEVQLIENQIHGIQSLAEELQDDADPVRLLSAIFQNSAFMVLEKREIAFDCHCSWEKVSRALALVGADELQSMLTEDGRASVRCDFCNQDYLVTGPQLEEMIKSSRQH